MTGKVYISGKIGEEVISLATRLRFANAEEMLKAKGYEVVNPAGEEFQRRLELHLRGMELDCMYTHKPFNKLAEIMQFDIRKLTGCDYIYMLDGFTISRGATLEYDYAMYVGIQPLYQNKEYALSYLEMMFNIHVLEKPSGLGGLDDKFYKRELNEWKENNINDCWLPLYEK